MTGRRLAPALLALALVLAALPLPAQTSDCPDWVARTVSVQGRVETRRAGQVAWLPVKLEATHCPGDAVRLGPLSRAALALRDGAILRLDQNTTITFTPPAERAATWIELLTGAVHFWSRTPRGLRITTPFVNGSVEGTEFLIEVDAVEARLSVWEGRVLAENAQGSLTLTAGQSAAARAGQAPMLRADRRETRGRRRLGPLLSTRPRPSSGRLPRPARRDLAGGGPPLDRGGPARRSRGGPRERGGRAGHRHRPAGLRLPGRAPPRGRASRRGRPVIERALRWRLSPATPSRCAPWSRVAKNDRPGARTLAKQAVQADPGSAAAHVAHSYARQAAFDLNGALAERPGGGAARPGERPGARAPRRALAVARQPRPRAGSRDGGRAARAGTRAPTPSWASPP